MKKQTIVILICDGEPSAAVLDDSSVTAWTVITPSDLSDVRSDSFIFHAAEKIKFLLTLCNRHKGKQ